MQLFRIAGTINCIERAGATGVKFDGGADARVSGCGTVQWFHKITSGLDVGNLCKGIFRRSNDDMQSLQHARDSQLAPLFPTLEPSILV